MTNQRHAIRAAILRELQASAPDGFKITTRALLSGVSLAVSPEPTAEAITAERDRMEEEGLINSEVHPLKGRRWGLTPLGHAALA